MSAEYRSDLKQVSPGPRTGREEEEPSARPSRPAVRGLWHLCARWVLDHPRQVRILTVLGVLAFCGWKAWAAFQPNYTWADADTDSPVLLDRIDATAVRLGILLAWIFLSSVVVRGKLDSMRWSGWWDTLSFHARVRDRMLRGTSISGGVLLAYTLFAVVGMVCALALAGQALSLLPWLGSASSRLRSYHFLAPLVSLVSFWTAARLLWQVQVQVDWEDQVGDRRALLAEAMLREEEADRDEEREAARKSVGLGSWVVLIGATAGLLFFASQLPDAEQGGCILSALAGLVAVGIGLYVVRTKPRGRVGWLTLLVGLYAGALAYSWGAFPQPTLRSFLFGAVSGAVVGAAFTTLYLRKVARGG